MAKDTREELEACLHRCGALDGSPDERMELAACCAAEGITCNDVLLLYDHLVRRRSRDPGGLLAYVLQHRKRAKDQIRDLKRGAERRIGLADRRQNNSKTLIAGPSTPGSARESYQSRIAYNMDQGGSTLAEISAALECTEARVRELIEIERRNQEPKQGQTDADQPTGTPDQRS